MVVVLVLAGLAVLGAVVVLAMGRGGELAPARPDHPPFRLPPGRALTAPDVAMLRLPRGLWGYQVEVADETLHRLAYALSERDVRVAELEHQVDVLRRRLGDAGVDVADDLYAPYDREIEPKLYGSGERAPWDDSEQADRPGGDPADPTVDDPVDLAKRRDEDDRP
ncbi:hypothetical protein Acsp04_01110 [Actinomadura sp. NBRC 104425]|uniref:hypothetical protein n=1 Tax=Actinomadura sp. NBRC 104425 TaxID=3032204 RepID=UPI0024A18084|nr:hypothetical protein [Actinomadura sp. NBRC 104425]GLZ09875.1 hypothetical protein Acsp04_01110 [Actinomadura sp. NBRC 104425]